MIEFTKHFERMMEERSIKPEWVEHALKNPEKTEVHEDGTHHYLCRIREHGNRWLRVIVNTQIEPRKGVTTFFDRRVGRTT